MLHKYAPYSIAKEILTDAKFLYTDTQILFGCEKQKAIILYI